MKNVVTLEIRLVFTPPANLCTICTSLNSTDPDYLFATDSMGLSLFTSTQRAVKKLHLKIQHIHCVSKNGPLPLPTSQHLLIIFWQWETLFHFQFS